MKEKISIKCRKCASQNPPVISYMEKQLWGAGNKGQHFRLTCSNPKCDFAISDINQSFIELLEENENGK